MKIDFKVKVWESVEVFSRETFNKIVKLIKEGKVTTSSDLFKFNIDEADVRFSFSDESVEMLTPVMTDSESTIEITDTDGSHIWDNKPEIKPTVPFIQLENFEGQAEGIIKPVNLVNANTFRQLVAAFVGDTKHLEYGIDDWIEAFNEDHDNKWKVERFLLDDTFKIN